MSGRMTAFLKTVAKPRVALFLCIGTSAALVGGAHLFERVGGLAPCLLCLDQREAHWAAIAAGILTFGLLRVFSSSNRFLAAAFGALTLIYIFSAGLASYHAGVEWGFWPGPQTCSGGSADLGALAQSDILGSLSEGDAGPSCSEAAWRLAGISMAGYNAIASLALAALAAASCMHLARGLRRESIGVQQPAGSY